MKFDVLQNRNIFMLGCTVEAGRLKALICFARPSHAPLVAGKDETLVEPYRANNTKIIATLPDDLEPLYTYLDMEIVSCETDLVAN